MNSKRSENAKSLGETIKAQSLFVLIALLSTATLPLKSHAYNKDKNWPCVQAKVLKLSAGQMWRGEPLDLTDNSWKKNERAKNLAKKIMPRRVTLSKTETIIAKFVQNNKDSVKTELAQTFLVLLEETNRIRQEIIGGINQFAKRQKALAKRITKTRQKVLELEKLDETSPLTKEQDKELLALEQALEWDTRIYEEREQSLEYVCEAPVILEQRLFALSKQLIKHSPK